MIQPHRPPGLLARLTLRPSDLLWLAATAAAGAVLAAVGASWVVLRDIDITNTLLCGDDE